MQFRLPHSLLKKVSDNVKVIENYFFMTALQIISSMFGIIIYPYLIRALGTDSYGLYVFSLSTTSYFISLINFGFNFPATKEISQNKDNLLIKQQVVSCIISAKVYLALVSSLIFTVLLYCVPTMREHKIVFIYSFLQITGEVLFPVWYFQGVQKMRIVTYIQLSFRVLSVPFILFLVKAPTDCSTYTAISSATVVFSAIVSLLYIYKKDQVAISFRSLKSLKSYFIDALPFFFSSSAGTIKQSSVAIIIGSYFGMTDVALYDLANKIILVPRTLTMSINSALFPKIIKDTKKQQVRKIIWYETLIGFAVIAAVAIGGHWIVLWLGGPAMMAAYPLAIILSATVLVWLVVGSYISFVFVPANLYYFATRNQLVALVSFFLLCVPILYFVHDITVVVAALTLSGICEIAYCNYLIKKHRLL